METRTRILGTFPELKRRRIFKNLKIACQVAGPISTMFGLYRIEGLKMLSLPLSSPLDSVQQLRHPSVSQILIIPSPLPEATSFPSGEKATESTSAECPLSVSNSFPVAAFQSFMALPSPPDARSLPSGEKAMDGTCSTVSAGAVGHDAVASGR